MSSCKVQKILSDELPQEPRMALEAASDLIALYACPHIGTQQVLPGHSGFMKRDSLHEVVAENIAMDRPLRVSLFCTKRACARSG